jgi:hypothetical protein
MSQNSNETLTTNSTSSPPEYTKAQLETIQVLQRNELAKIAFWAAMIAFGVILITIIVSIFLEKGAWYVQLGLTLLNGLVGWVIRHIFKFLFPPICQDAKTGKIKALEK